MPEQSDPFSRYIAEVLQHMRHLPARQRSLIADELRAHLEDAASEFGERAPRQITQELVIHQLGSSRRLGRALAKANRTNDQHHRWRQLALLLRVTAAAGATLMLAFLLLLTLFVVPPASPSTATEISGVVRSISAPHAAGGDMTIVLQDGRNFYVNRANERQDFAWQQLRAEVERGDQITLTAVEPLAWRINPFAPEPGRGVAYTPLAGVRTPSIVYLDAQHSAQHTGQPPTPLPATLMLAGFVIACVLPELRRAVHSVGVARR